jgi:hypothetical protein
VGQGMKNTHNAPVSQNLVKSYDKMIKSFIIHLFERDTWISYPKNFMNSMLGISSDFDRMDTQSIMKQTAFIHNSSFLSQSGGINHNSIDSESKGDHTPS